VEIVERFSALGGKFYLPLYIRAALILMEVLELKPRYWRGLEVEDHDSPAQRPFKPHNPPYY
jgi:hypothetical protein